MPTKQPAKKTTEAKKSEAPAKEKKLSAKARKLDETGGGDSKNATGN